MQAIRWYFSFGLLPSKFVSEKGVPGRSGPGAGMCPYHVIIERLSDVIVFPQDFLICIEMFFAAIAHYFSFSHKPYVDYALGYQNIAHSFKAMFDVSDVRDDVVHHVRTVSK